MKLTREEQAIENAIGRGEYVRSSRKEFNEIARMLARHKKQVVVRIKIGQGDLDALKARAKRDGVSHQAFITKTLCEFVHTK